MVQRWLFSGTASSTEEDEPQLNVKISFPRRSRGTMYVCTVELTSNNQKQRAKAYGADSLQAISNAKAHTRRLIESFGTEYRIGLDRYQSVFPLDAPFSYGSDVQNEIESYIKAISAREENRTTGKFRNKNPDDQL